MWALNQKERPETVLTTQSMLTQIACDPDIPWKVYGGCFNGQIVMWDTRDRGLPVNRSTFDLSHCFPVQGLKAVGNDSLISVSSEGLLIKWNGDLTHLTAC